MDKGKSYDDIINLPRPLSRHQPMSMEKRAAQFAPFATLHGHEEALRDTAQQVEDRVERRNAREPWAENDGR